MSEILYQLDNKVDMVVLGAGTGGTVTGVGRRIKEECPNCVVVAVDPDLEICVLFRFSFIISVVVVVVGVVVRGVFILALAPVAVSPVFVLFLWLVFLIFLISRNKARPLA